MLPTTIEIIRSGLKGDPSLNRISEAWIGGCAAIRGQDMIIPDDDNFRAQSLSRKQRTGAGGKLQIEPKDEYMKRGFESPHEGDSIFGAMLPIRGWQRVNLLTPHSPDQPDDRWWGDRADDSGDGYILPAESCL